MNIREKLLEALEVLDIPASSIYIEITRKTNPRDSFTYEFDDNKKAMTFVNNQPDIEILDIYTM
jgi:hypothetical protein